MSKNIDNVFDYIKWRGDLTFEQDPFNEVDCFILTQVTFLNFSKIINDEEILLKDALEMYFKENEKDKVKLGLIFPQHIVDFIHTLIKVKRYCNIKISNFVDKFDEIRKEQFAAMTFHIDDKNIVIVYKGTDDTLIGWEENFNMIVNFPIAAQVSALDYFKDISKQYKNSNYILAGHSKGGNLAMYSSIYIDEDIQKKIIRVYNFDGPGFEAGDIDLKLYEKVKNKIITILPEHSAIGMIFNQIGRVKSIKSNFKGLHQHDGISWNISKNRFVKTNLSKDSIAFSKDLNDLISTLSDDDRKLFCDSIEKFIKKVGVKTLMELKSIKKLLVIVFKGYSKQERTLFFKLLKILIKYKMLF